MSATVVRYQAKPERADENQKLIESGFADLDARSPKGFTYKVFRLDDGISFIHVVVEHEGVEDPDSLQDVPAFQAFVADIAVRTGKGRSTIARDVTRAKKVAVLNDIAGTCLDKGDEIDALGKLPKASSASSRL